MNQKARSMIRKSIGLLLSSVMCLQIPAGVFADESSTCEGTGAVGSNPYAGEKYLVTFDPDAEVGEGTVQYAGKDMFWSEKYGQWCILTDSEDAPSASEFTWNAGGTKQTVSYSGDLNLNQKITITDAQIAYDLAKGSVYTDYSKLSMAQWLSADFNADGSISALDARAVQTYLHTGAYDGQDSEGTLLTGMHITKNGTYRLKPGTSGEINIDAGLTVKLVGREDTEAFNDLYIDCGEEVNLTLKDIYISDTVSQNIIDFKGEGNILKAEGTNIIENTSYVSNAVIHVGPETELTFEDGGGYLYMYKRTQGSGVGSDAEEANGHITFDGGNWFFKGSKTGAVIGNDTCGDAEKEAQIGDITINGGVIYIESNARGAAIGGSNLSRAGNVYMTGGQVNIFNDWTGSAIGAGASMCSEDDNNGNIEITGGSLRTYITSNASTAWGVSAGYSNAALKANKTDVDGQKVYLYKLNLSDYIAGDTQDIYSVEVDGEAFYTGTQHKYMYEDNDYSTTANWVPDADTYLYLYLTSGEHLISVNGEDEYSINVTDSDITADPDTELRQGFWTEAADTSWYNEKDSEFTISSAEQLAGLSLLVMNDTDTFENKTIYLGEDIDLSDYYWESIGQRQNGIDIFHPFCGTFDGNSHSITGILQEFTNNDDSAFGPWGAGLFGYAKNAVFKNVIIKDGKISCIENGGGIAGYAPGCSFYNCENHADINGKRVRHNSTYYYGDYCGGISGNGGIYFESCVNYGKITGNGNIGGIAGAGGGDCRILECENNGEISAQWGDAAGIIRGSSDVLGKNTNRSIEIKNCINNAPVTSEQGPVGGMVGEDFPHPYYITGCVNNGSIAGSASGGIMGGVFDTTATLSIVITDCYNTGSVSSSYALLYGSAAGGIMGSFKEYNGNNFCISDCYNTGTVTCSSSGELNAGGILGAFYTINALYESTRYKNSEIMLVSDSLYSRYQNFDDTYSGDRSYPVLCTLENNYYLDSSCRYGDSGDVSNAGMVERKNTEELKAFAEILGDSFTTDNDNINQGYPVLCWQAGKTEETSHSIILNVAQQEAAVKVSDAFGNEIMPEGDGSYKAEPGMAYVYEVKADGFITEKGVVPAQNSDCILNICMDEIKLKKTAAFTSNVDDFEVTLTYSYPGGYFADYSLNTILTKSVNSKFYLDDHKCEVYAPLKYGYTAAADGYKEITGEFVVGEEDILINLEFVKE